MPLESIESHSLLPDLVAGGGTVIDCGANLGAFARVMVQRFGCRVLALEASPAVFRQLPELPGLQARNIAVCGNNEPVRLQLDADITRTAIDRNAVAGEGTIEVPGRTLPSLLADARIFGEIEVLKLDIEGAELAAIDSLPDELILRIGQITVEFHDRLGYHTVEDVERRIRRIVSLGFRELYWSRRRNTGDVLLVNGRRLGPLRHAIEQRVIRPVRAIGRLMERRIAAL